MPSAEHTTENCHPERSKTVSIATGLRSRRTPIGFPGAEGGRDPSTARSSFELAPAQDDKAKRLE